MMVSAARAFDMQVASEHIPHLSTSIIDILKQWAVIILGSCCEVMSSVILIEIVSHCCRSGCGPAGVNVIICLSLHIIRE